MKGLRLLALTITTILHFITDVLLKTTKKSTNWCQKINMPYAANCSLVEN